MPIYPIRCPHCTYSGDVFAKVSELSDGMVVCPVCGRLADQNYQEKRVFSGNREFHGEMQESLTEGWGAHEVPKVQKEMAEMGHTDAANCIRPDGSVVFHSREEQRKYMEAKAAIWKKVAESPGISEQQYAAEMSRKRAKALRKMQKAIERQNVEKARS